MRNKPPKKLQASKVALAIFAISAGWRNRKSVLYEIQKDFDEWLVPTFGARANRLLLALAFKSLLAALIGEAKDWFSIYSGVDIDDEKEEKILQDKTNLDD